MRRTAIAFLSLAFLSACDHIVDSDDAVCVRTSDDSFTLVNQHPRAIIATAENLEYDMNAREHEGGYVVSSPAGAVTSAGTFTARPESGVCHTDLGEDTHQVYTLVNPFVPAINPLRFDQ